MLNRFQEKAGLVADDAGKRGHRRGEIGQQFLRLAVNCLIAQRLEAFLDNLANWFDGGGLNFCGSREISTSPPGIAEFGARLCPTKIGPCEPCIDR